MMELRIYAMLIASVLSLVATWAGAARADDIAFTLTTRTGRLDVPVASKPVAVGIWNTKNKQPMIVVRVDPKHAERLCLMTRQGVGGPMWLHVGCDMVTSVVVQSPVCEGTFNVFGGFNRAQAEDYLRRMKQGAPPCTDLKK